MDPIVFSLLSVGMVIALCGLGICLVSLVQIQRTINSHQAAEIRDKRQKVLTILDGLLIVVFGLAAGRLIALSFL